MELELDISKVVEVSGVERWQVYQRLQELAIPCGCAPNQPLRVQIETATAAAQLWSVVKQLTAPHCDLVHWLEHCWQI